MVSSTADPRLTPEELENYAVYGFQSELGIPLVGTDGVIGLIDLFDISPRDYSEYLDYTRSVGQIVAGALQTTLLMEQRAARMSVRSGEPTSSPKVSVKPTSAFSRPPRTSCARSPRRSPPE